MIGDCIAYSLIVHVKVSWENRVLQMRETEAKGFGARVRLMNMFLFDEVAEKLCENGDVEKCFSSFLKEEERELQERKTWEIKGVNFRVKGL
ncbi:hypothetical protein MTR_3g006520 [Medicago truncatula]|uniref:Uncharacterized protein n=1 Tax=Medicago truncatula TaxID=3880 RepID=A0A072UT52_MEDTR|nr:hypothetical protein MTR_3g006520 [Medicago truncatula]